MNTKTTVSIKNTPVQRALAKSKKPLLLALFVVGILAGFLYKQNTGERPAEPAPTAVQQQKQ